MVSSSSSIGSCSLSRHADVSGIQPQAGSSSSLNPSISGHDSLCCIELNYLERRRLPSDFHDISQRLAVLGLRNNTTSAVMVPPSIRNLIDAALSVLETPDAFDASGRPRTSTEREALLTLKNLRAITATQYRASCREGADHTEAIPGLVASDSSAFLVPPDQPQRSHDQYATELPPAGRRRVSVPSHDSPDSASEPIRSQAAPQEDPSAPNASQAAAAGGVRAPFGGRAAVFIPQGKLSACLLLPMLLHLAGKVIMTLEYIQSQRGDPDRLRIANLIDFSLIYLYLLLYLDRNREVLRARATDTGAVNPSPNDQPQTARDDGDRSDTAISASAWARLRASRFSPQGFAPGVALLSMIGSGVHAGLRSVGAAQLLPDSPALRSYQIAGSILGWPPAVALLYRKWNREILEARRGST
jgi:hypothetical protein